MRNLDNLNKKTNAAIVAVLILLLSVSTLAIAVQTVQAQQNAKASIYIFITTTYAGLNQNIQVVVFMSSVTPDAVENTGSRWQNVDVTITRPDGTTDARHFSSLDAVASAFFFYPATQIGTYQFQASFPGQTIPAFINPLGLSSDVPIDYGPATSNIATVTVTQTPELAPTDVPLPTGYWTRPIIGADFNWWMISSNWLLPGWDYAGRQFDQGSAYDRFTQAPDSAHILWTTPITFGGLIGGEYGGNSFYNGMSYEQYFKPPVIIAGRVYYNSIVGQEPTSITSTGVNTYTTVHQESQSSIICLDLKTGEELFKIPNASCSFGQIYNYISPNQGGGLPYLWDTNGPGGTWKMYDPWTGQYILSLANVPTGTMVLDNTWNMGPSGTNGPGDILIYTIDITKGTLSMWNSSAVVNPRTTAALNPGLPESILALAGQNPFLYRPENYMGITFNSTGTTVLPTGFVGDTNGIMWTVPIKDFATLNASGNPGIVQIGYDNTIWVMAGHGPSIAVFSLPPYETWASYSMIDGSQMSAPVYIDMTTKLPMNGTAYDGVNMPRIVDSDGNFAIYNKESLSLYSWNVKTGAFNWGPVQVSDNGWALYNWETDFVADNVVYNWGFDGQVHAVDSKTGQKLWDFDAGQAGSLNPYGVNALYQGLLIADGKIYAQTGDHGNGAQPLYQGEMLYCMDQSTGQSLWNMSGWFLQPAIADGIMLSQNEYDNLIYAFGKGPTATTVDAPMTQIAKGTSFIIQGTVTDQSPGKSKGTAAISDQYMSEWMAYIYEQVPLPSNFPCDCAGVPVTLTATDLNRNTQTIGTAVVDASGHFAYTWSPSTAGSYIITATFGGSNSYYSSTAETCVVVGTTSGIVNPTPTPTPSGSVAPAPGGIPVSTWYIIIAAIVIIIIVVVAAVALRRRK